MLGVAHRVLALFFFSSPSSICLLTATASQEAQAGQDQLWRMSVIGNTEHATQQALPAASPLTLNAGQPGRALYMSWAQRKRGWHATQWAAACNCTPKCCLGSVLAAALLAGWPRTSRCSQCALCVWQRPALHYLAVGGRENWLAALSPACHSQSPLTLGLSVSCNGALRQCILRPCSRLLPCPQVSGRCCPGWACRGKPQEAAVGPQVAAVPGGNAQGEALL